jgi:hypothetical protein
MGLLDSLLSNSSNGGGLLDFLRNNALNQQFSSGLPSDQAQYGAQPMQAMAQAPSSPSYAPISAPQQNAQPSPLDGASWPYGPNGAPSQANAQMAQPVPQQPPPVIPAQPQQAMQLQGPGFGDRLMAGIQGFANGGGILPALANGISGLATGQRNDPQGIAQQSQNLTLRALIQKGVDPVTAQAAIGNPELLKTVVAQAYGPQNVENLGSGYIRDPRSGQITRAYSPDKTPMSIGNGYIYDPATKQTTRAYEPDDKFQHVTVKNADGSESQVTFDPSTGKYSGAPAAPAGRFAVDDNLTGQARLDALRKADPDYARRIESMVNGDIPLPTGVAALKPNADRMIKDVLAVDGATSSSDFATRAATRKDYASGIASRVTKSINTTIGHFATLDQTIDKLGNYSYFPHAANAIHDAYASNMDPNYQKAKATFETNKEAAIKELDFALSGGHSSVSGSAELRDKFNRADSPEALHAAVAEAMSLLQKRLQSHTKAFNEGTKSQRDEQDFLYPENRASFNKLMGSEDTSTGQGVPGVSASGAPATASPALQPGQSTKIGGVTIRRVN